MCIGVMLAVLPLVLHVYMCNISCSYFYLYMCIGVILAVLSISLTCVYVLYWLFFVLALHV